MPIESYELKPAIEEMQHIVTSAHRKRQLLFVRAFGAGNTDGKTNVDLKNKITALKASVLGIVTALTPASSVDALALTLATQAERLKKVSGAIDEMKSWRAQVASINTKYAEFLTAIDDEATANPTDAGVTAQKAQKDRLVASAIDLKNRIENTETAVDAA